MTDKPTMFSMDGTPVTPKHQAAYEADLLESLKNSFKEEKAHKRKRAKEIRSQLGYSRIGRNNI